MPLVAWAYTLPDSGSPARLVKPRRSRTMPVSQTLNLYSLSTWPVASSRHMTRSCWPTPSPTLLMMYTRPFWIIGVLMPPYGALHTRLLGASFLGDHLSGRSFSRETPFCSGPRQRDQSAALASVASLASMAARQHNAISR